MEQIKLVRGNMVDRMLMGSLETYVILSFPLVTLTIKEREEIMYAIGYRVQIAVIEPELPVIPRTIIRGANIVYHAKFDGLVASESYKFAINGLIKFLNGNLEGTNLGYGKGY